MAVRVNKIIEYDAIQQPECDYEVEAGGFTEWKQHSANDNSNSLCIISTACIIIFTIKAVFIVKAVFIIKDWMNFESSAEVSKKGFEHAQETACFSSAE